ncbi:MFS general substrate transporter [Lentinus tigrinus ALCF2SS1-7]|uniref:MFS general substrate transporter n=1 Tax=Lentinus tigrinus ALCF2SS1-7 TaxID=1328758 RepID=UPI00116613E1|nr:MFS general substrate transporter [Lentinus tigrinus ALCF2SS1-7]
MMAEAAGLSRQGSRSPATYPPARQEEEIREKKKGSRPPWGLVWRSSIWFITLAVGLGVTTDILVYSMIVPIIPFRLQSLGYEGVSGLVGWLLFAYSAALVVSTPPIAYVSEKYRNRKIPLLCGQFALIGSQIMLMEAPTFAVMVIARICQGISASVIWVVGLALVCDTVPETIVGKQLGLVMMGMTLGFLVGPPVAGALDDRFGFRGPFIFGVITTALEFICRLLIIERKDAIRWDASLTGLVQSHGASRDRAYGATATDTEKRDEQPVNTTTRPTDEENTAVTAPAREPATNEAQQSLSIVGLLLTLLKSPRAMAPVYLTFIYGVIITSQEPALPLYLQSTYGLDVSKVGLVYLAAVIPSFISSPLSGWYADRGGTVTSTLVCAICTVPFYVLIFIKGPLAYFLVMFAILNFFSSALISPVTAELAAVTRSLDGVGYGHTYGAFNVAYGIGSAVGPVVGGQLYDHVKRGWMALSLFDLGMVLFGITIVICFFGERPLLKRAVSRVRGGAYVDERNQEHNRNDEAATAAAV